MLQKYFEKTKFFNFLLESSMKFTNFWFSFNPAHSGSSGTAPVPIASTIHATAR